MTKQTTVTLLIIFAILDGISLLASTYILIKGKFRLDKLMHFLEETFTFCCPPLVSLRDNSNRFGLLRFLL